MDIITCTLPGHFVRPRLNAALVLLCLMCQASSQELSIALRQSREDWLREVSFKGTYRVVRGEASTLRDAFDGNFHVVGNESTGGVESTGMIVKSGGKVRLSKHFASTPVVEKLSVDSSKIRALGFDEVSVDGLSAVLRDKFPGSSETALAGKRQGSSAGGMSFAAGKLSRFEVTPLCPLPFPPENLLDFEGRKGMGPWSGIVENIVIVENSKIELRFKGKTDAGVSVERDIVFDNSKTPPVVVSAVEKTVSGEVVFEFGSIYKDFVHCSGGWVGKRIIYAQSDRSAVGSQAFRVREWISDDLGNSEPNSDDFVLELGSDSRVLGFRGRHSNNSNLDLGEYTQKDLRAVTPSASVKQNGYRIVTILLMAIPVCLVAVLMVFGYFRRRCGTSRTQ